eukprot:260236_1
MSDSLRSTNTEFFVNGNIKENEAILLIWYFYRNNNTMKTEELTQEIVHFILNYCAIDIATMFEKYKDRIENFEQRVVEFPVDSNRIISEDWNTKELRKEIYDHMRLCYPLLHGSVISLADHFLSIKKEHGSEIEKKFYSHMTLVQLFDRLATKRCVVFYQTYDSYVLRNGSNGAGGWNNIGSNNENAETSPKLNDYLSYDELLLSSLCGISSPTHFINDGSRRNCGRVRKNSIYPIQGIYMGLVGARFEKNDVMEYSLMVVTNNQNKIENGYGKDNASSKNRKMIWDAFKKFYARKYFPTYTEINENYNNDNNIQNRYYKDQGWGMNNSFLDIEMYKQRIRISIELFLFDADNRAKQYKQLYNVNAGAYCHIIGLGTGVWSFKKSIQDAIIVKVTYDIIKKTNLSNIDCVYFSWMDEDCMDDIKDNLLTENIQNNQNIFYINSFQGNNKIYIDCGKRAPADILSKKFENCLIVAMYAWDSNSFVGNEYYHGMLSASGDPAAASCSTISFVQNSEINKEYINGKNTGVYFYNSKHQTYEFYKFTEIDFENNKEKWLNKSMDSKRT